MSTVTEKVSVKYMIKIDSDGYEIVKAQHEVNPMNGDVMTTDKLRNDIMYLNGVEDATWDFVPQYLEVEVDAKNNEETIMEVTKLIEKHIKGE